MHRQLLIRLTPLALALAVPAVGHAQPAVEFFEKKVRPILVDHCYTCHSADTNPSGGLRVDDRNGLITGGNTGPAVVPGKPAESLLLRRVTQPDVKKRMPREGKHLTEEQVAVLTTWIKDGAAWPTLKIANLNQPKPEYEKLRKDHWAFQPIRDPKPPVVKDTTWTKDDVDRFLRGKLEAKGLKPVGDADKVTLIRRITFDMTGLPPTQDEIDGFVKDTSDKAFETVVDRLLASKAYGERWGRHWLDVARYGESTGPSRNIPYPHAWKYRDYVIDSVNADVPYDRFLTEQIAGDLLTASSDAEKDRLLTATGFLAIGVKDVNQRFKVRFEMDNVDEQIDAVTRSALALTVSCARCHDHKFDPVPQADYYALAGIFTSTENAAGVRNKMGGGGLDYYNPAALVRLSTSLPDAPAEQVAKVRTEYEAAKKAWDAIRGTPEGLAKAANGQPTQRPYRLKFEKLEAELQALTDPAVRGHVVHGVRDGKTIADTSIRIRGEAEKIGPAVPRGFLTAFDVPDAAKVNPAQSGRLELANWLTSAKNPLAARVAVNRVWQHLFGQGIVSTVDNFGVTGDMPSNPDLLDHLATRFVREGWSVKKLVRSLVLTRAYRLGSDAPAALVAVDPSNKLVWRHSPRRLDAEEIRDAALASAGAPDRTRPTGSPAQGLKMIEMPDNGPEAGTVRGQADGSRARSVYLPLLRGVTPAALEAFDPVEQTLVTGRRDATTVPGQALFLLNSAFIRKKSLALAERVLVEKEAADEARVTQAYRLALGRAPTDTEVGRARTFIVEYESAYRAEPPVVPPPPKKAPAKKGNEPPFDPDQVDQTGEPVVEQSVTPKDARTAAWMAFAQALYGSAEFRFVR